MRNIQVIDGADNCAYDIFEMCDEDFQEMFPGEGQDIEFVGDFVARAGNERSHEILKKLWKKRIDKRLVDGIHGTLFYELDFKNNTIQTKKNQI